MFGHILLPCMQLMQFQLAKEDCNSALKLEQSAKALLRRGMANQGLQDFEAAKQDFKAVLRVEPNNR